MATIRQRSRGVWEVRVFVGRDDAGKPVQMSRTVRGGKKDAERVAAQLQLAPAKHAGRTTVAELLDAWQDLRRDTWAPYTRRDVASRSQRISEDRIGKLPLARLQVSDIDAWLTRIRRAGVGEGSIRNQLQTLRTALAQAVRWGWIMHNPAAAANHRRPKATPRGVMSGDEVRRILAAAPDVHEMAPIALRLGAITGARRSELAALQWTDLDGSTLTIDSALVAVREGSGETLTSEVRDLPTKTGDRRRVALDPETMRMIEAQRNLRATITKWMFSDTERPPHPDRVGYWWKRARILSEVDLRWRLHDLRHWSATAALGGGYDLATVAQRLGHSDPSVTLRVYSHALAERDADVAASLSQLLSDDPA